MPAMELGGGGMSRIHFFSKQIYPRKGLSNFTSASGQNRNTVIQQISFENIPFLQNSFLYLKQPCEIETTTKVPVLSMNQNPKTDEWEKVEDSIVFASSSYFL